MRRTSNGAEAHSRGCGSPHRGHFKVWRFFIHTMRKKYPYRSKTFTEGWVSLICIRCGDPFWVIPSQQKYLKTCSSECQELPLMERILARITKVQGSEPTECWLCDMGINIDGYSTVKHDGKTVRSHRVVYEHLKGPIPLGLDLLHRCVARRNCVNPDHSYPGTAKDNQRDCIDQGRRPVRAGELCPTAKLTDEQVMEIRNARSKESMPTLAKRFGVAVHTIWLIWTSKTWSHLPPCAVKSKLLGTAKIGPDDVRQIRAESAAGARGKDLAVRFGISVAAISAIINRKRWPNVE